MSGICSHSAVGQMFCNGRSTELRGPVTNADCYEDSVAELLEQDQRLTFCGTRSSNQLSGTEQRFGDTLHDSEAQMATVVYPCSNLIFWMIKSNQSIKV